MKDPVDGLRSYKRALPVYNPRGKTLIRLAFENKTGANLEFPLHHDIA